MADILTASDIQWPIIAPDGESEDGAGSPWDTAQKLAVDWVWGLSGRKFGQWTITFRPEWTIPVARASRHMVLSGPDWPGAYPVRPITSSRLIYRAPLPGPAVSVSEVLVDGSALPSSAYELNDDTLIRVDGQAWYRSQDTTLPTSDVGTWQITYLRGVPVPTGGQVAAGILAAEYVKALTGDKSCRLPNNTTSVSRNGVAVSLDALQLQKGFTGIREVDQWCRIVNPKGRQQPPTVWSPDLDPGMLRPPRTDATA